MVTVVALRDFAFAGHAVNKGDPVDMEPIQAAVHAQSGDVSLLARVPARPTYQTRDMIALPVPAAFAQEPAVVPTKPKRRSRRPRS